jgi:hypothetical protein
MTTTGTNQSRRPLRFLAFAGYFKEYMSVSSIVVAALPIPVTSLELIPTFADHRTVLSVYTSLFCFLLFAFIFYSRHALARWLFPEYSKGRSPESARVLDHGERTESERLPSVLPEESVTKIPRLERSTVGLLPLLLIALSVASVLYYHHALNVAVAEIECGPAPTTVCENQVSRHEVLDTRSAIPNETLIIGLYIGIFAFAEAAFVLMATKEYLQETLHVSDVELIRRE